MKVEIAVGDVTSPGTASQASLTSYLITVSSVCHLESISH